MIESTVSILSSFPYVAEVDNPVIILLFRLVSALLLLGMTSDCFGGKFVS
jgi:hypothetical protein